MPQDARSTRRQFVAACAACGATVALAGCLGGDDNELMDPETPPADVLPEEGDGWEIDEQGSWESDLLADDMDAATATYTGPEGGFYRVVVVRVDPGDTDPEEFDLQVEDVASEDEMRAEFEGVSMETTIVEGLFVGYFMSDGGGNVADLVDRSGFASPP